MTTSKPSGTVNRLEALDDTLRNSETEDGTSLTPNGALYRFQVNSDVALSSVQTIELLQEVAARFSAGEKYFPEDLAMAKGEEYAATGRFVRDRLIHELNDAHINRFSHERLKHYYDTFVRPHRTIRPRVRNKTWLELGCGAQNPAGFLFLLLILGAKKCIGVDLDPIQDRTIAWKALTDVATTMLIDPKQIVGRHSISRHQILDRIESFDLAKLAAGVESGVDSSRFIHLQEAAEKLSVPDASVDVTFSTSFLEHVNNFEDVVREMSRITVPGGFGIHAIDGADHRIYLDPSLHPLAFLEESRQTLDGECCNKIRPLEMIEVFERHGFQLMEWDLWERVELSNDQIGLLAEPYRSMPRESLEVVRAVLIVQREGGRKPIAERLQTLKRKWKLPVPSAISRNVFRILNRE
jgi:SAM-dependent methyltransferase